jgi:F0F1-type ATP synthase membrane subunit b/b'
MGKYITITMDRNTLVKRFVIGTFITLYALVSIISTIHVIDFFELSNPYWLAVTLAIGFEIGAAASLASLVILKKMNKTLVWSLFITITLMQMQGNMYYAFINLENFGSWSELFDLIDEDLIDQKRILAFVSGAILPLIALGFIKSLIDYIKPEDEEEEYDDEIPEDSMLNDIEVTIESDAEQMYDSYVDRQVPDPIDDAEFFAAHDKGIDEEHALDMVLNDMVEDLSDEDLDEIFNQEIDKAEESIAEAEKEIAEAEKEIAEAEFEVEDTYGNVEVVNAKNLDLFDEKAVESSMQIIKKKVADLAEEDMDLQDDLDKASEEGSTEFIDEDLFKKGLEAKAKQNMNDYIKKKPDANN